MPEKTFWSQIAQAWNIGLTLVVSTISGGLMGYGLDYVMGKWFGIHTKPWLTFVFLILGIIAGFRELYKIATKPDKYNEPSSKKDI
ncbi:MAG: AtpZ/AtpI family protein [Nitrospirota bacterium]